MVASGDRNKPEKMVSGTKEVIFDADGKPKSLGVSSVVLDHYDSDNDFALLKIDPEADSNARVLENGEFPFIPISDTTLEEAEVVYAFGYPLSEGNLILPSATLIAGVMELRPRVTSAIVSSLIESQGMHVHSGNQQTYVLDKALNYGNSGGPIVSVETGNAHAFCSRFQPVFVPQQQGAPAVMIPSLYGIVSSLHYQPIHNALSSRGIL